MTIRNLLYAFGAIALLQLAALGFVISLIVSGEDDLAETESLRLRAFKLADQLRQSSDDLTRMARTFVVTGDPAYRDYFKRIASIRDGQEPRPANYDQIYWDFVVVGEPLNGETQPPQSLDRQLESLNLTETERQLLRSAKSNSDALIEIESRAMAAVAGTSDDLEAARALMFSDEYHQAKASIMKPIDEFLVSVTDRMDGAVADARTRLDGQLRWAVALVALILFSCAVAAMGINRRIVGPVNALIRQTTAIKKGQYGKIVDIRSNDEIGVLVNAFNEMSVGVSDDIHRREEAAKTLEKSKLETERAIAQLEQTKNELLDNEAQLSQSQTMLQALADSLPEFVSMKDPEGKYIFVNQKYEEWSGVSRDEVIGKTVYDIYEHEQAAAIEARDRSVAESGVTRSDESTRTYADGLTRTVLRTRVPVVSKQGAFLGVATVNHDITERKQEEEAYRQSEAQFRSVFETNAAGMALLDMSGKYVRVNNRFCEIVGYAEDKLLTMNWRDLTHAEDIERVEKLDKDVSNGNREEFTTERRLLRSDGEVIWTSLSSAQLLDGNGVPRQIFSFVQDISQQKATQNELAESEKRLGAIMDYVPAAMFVRDLQGHFELVNRTYERTRGVTRNDIIGKTVHEVYPEKQAEEYAAHDLKTIENARAVEQETKVNGGGGEERIFAAIKFPIQDSNGNTTAIGGVELDITERKKAEKELIVAKESAEKALSDLKVTQEQLVQSEKMASLGQLTAGIAHEIKNPLNFVNNFSETSVELLDELREELQDTVEKLDEDTRDDVDDIFDTLKGDLQKIHHHGGRADSIVKSMLLHARGDASEFVSTDINSLVEEAVGLAYHGERAKDKSFQTKLDQQLDGSAGAADLVPQEVTRVLVNLLTNSFYAITKRRQAEKDDDYEPTVTISTEDQGENVQVRVRDNGTGIPPDVREKLFDPFFTTKPTGEGTGLGMSMSFDIIAQQHNGRIEVDSEPGEFTQITITLPRHAKTDPRTGV